MIYLHDLNLERLANTLLRFSTLLEKKASSGLPKIKMIEITRSAGSGTSTSANWLDEPTRLLLPSLPPNSPQRNIFLKIC